MNYQETIDYLFSQLPIFQRVGKAAYKANLDNTNLLDEHLNYPHREYKIIHVAGTNGKGSVSHMLASILQESGYKTGLYTSPHYLDFRERIKVSGKNVSKEFVVDFIEDNKVIIEEISPSFFELTVAMAFDYFRHEKIDVAVIEVGMGGRLDSTNIVNPLVSIITNIGYDHQQFLGDTLDKIAFEKAGIIKNGVPVIVGESNEVTKPVFIKKAQEQNAELFFAEEEYKIPYSMLSTDEKQILNIEDSLGNILYSDLKLDLLGQYQLKNVKSVLCAVNVLKNELEVPENAIFGGLANTMSNTGIIGRFMTLDYNPRIICDAAHNKEGLTALFEQVNNIAYKKLHIIVGFVNDKSVETIIQLFPKQAEYYFTKADIPRSLHENDLKMIFNNNEYQGRCFASVAESVSAAKANALKDDFVIICGSTFIVADAIKVFR